MITGSTIIAGVIGSPVGHSLSPALHNAAFEAAGVDWVYVAFDVEPGRAADALRIRTIAEALTEQSSAIPTWVGNPTIGAVASREEVDGLPPTMLGRLSRADYWLRENASVHLPAAIMDGEATADQTGIGDMVRKMRGGGPPSIYGADPWRGAMTRAVPGRRVM